MNLFDFAPGREGYYGNYGGCFLPEILHSTIEELQAGFRAAKQDPSFWQEYRTLLSEYSCRPTPVTYLAGGRQFVVIAASSPRDPKAPPGSAYLAFALPDVGKGAPLSKRD